MRDDPLARAMFIAGWNGQTEEARGRLWNEGGEMGEAIRERWRYEASRVRSIIGIEWATSRRHPLPDDVVQCPLCGTTRLHGHVVDVGDDDSVSVNDVIGILAPCRSEPQECVCMLCGVDYPVWFAPVELWNRVVRLADGSDRWPFLCPTCFGKRAEADGVVSRLVLADADAVAGEHDYGKSFARNHVYWNYDLTGGAGLVRAGGFELRWFGFRIPWTDVAVGFVYKRLRW